MVPIGVFRLFRSVLELVYPPLCSGCSARLGDGDGVLCGSCLQLFPPADPNSTLYTAAVRRLCDEGNCHSLLALFVFEEGGMIQTLVHRVKYEGDDRLAVTLGRMMGAAIAERNKSARVDAIVPLPLHRSRYRERGFNQAERLASGIAETAGYTILPVLKRRRATRSQTTLSASARIKNVRNAFVVPHAETGRVKGKRLLLVDDVVTTGATLNDAARALVDAGSLRPVACTAALAG